MGVFSWSCSMADNRKVLVVDDDELLRDFYAKVLSSEGFDAVLAADGDEAIDILEENSDFVLAIIDLLMPVRTGWEVIEFIKKEGKLKDIPVIALTGLASSFSEFNRVETICETILHKGKFELPEFVEAINKTAKKG